MIAPGMLLYTPCLDPHSLLHTLVLSFCCVSARALASQRVQLKSIYIYSYDAYHVNEPKANDQGFGCPLRILCLH